MSHLAESFREIVQNHEAWLSAFPRERLRNWEHLLHSNEEAGLCEACVRELLQEHTDGVAPAEDPSHGGPDFVCLVRGQRFYVEATCLTMKVVSEHTGLSADFDPDSGARAYRDLTALLQTEAKGKASQCSRLDAPCILAVGTFHFDGSVLCGDEMHVGHLLTSTTGVSMTFDPERGEAKGDMFPTTNLRLSAMVRGGATRVEAARRSISAILLCGFGCKTSGGVWPVRGVLHPDAARPLPRSLLPGIRFAQLEPGFEQGRIEVKWT